MDKELEGFEKWDYKRLKRLERIGLKAYSDMREAPAMTPEAVVQFIHQLSPWNLKTTGVSILKHYAEATDSPKPVKDNERTTDHAEASSEPEGKPNE